MWLTFTSSVLWQHVFYSCSIFWANVQGCALGHANRPLRGNKYDICLHSSPHLFPRIFDNYRLLVRMFHSWTALIILYSSSQTWFSHKGMLWDQCRAKVGAGCIAEKLAGSFALLPRPVPSRNKCPSCRIHTPSLPNVWKSWSRYDFLDCYLIILVAFSLF